VEPSESPDPTLIVVPVRAETSEEIDPILQTLVSVTTSAPGTMVLVVDDRSPAPQAQLIEAAAAELAQQDGEGHSAAVNVGLTVAVEHGMDACLVSPGLTFERHGWLDRMRARTDVDGNPAAIVGGAVLEANNTIRHAGYYFSLFRRVWSARLRGVPEEVLEIQSALQCPVGVEIQFIRREWILKADGYDDLIEPPHSTFDFCLRVTDLGGQSVWEPTVWARAVKAADGEPDAKTLSATRLRVKHASVNLRRWSPEVVT
jgi:hypothetical protein